jgi:hypothetical protein
MLTVMLSLCQLGGIMQVQRYIVMVYSKKRVT